MQGFLEFDDITEAHKIGDKVEIIKGSSKGVTGHIGEIRHGAYKGAPKTYTVYHGDKDAVQVPKEHIRAIKNVSEEAEQIDELSKDTLQSYVGKAKTDYDKQRKRMSRAYYNDVDKYDDASVKSDARKAGIKTAKSKLAKEEVEAKDKGEYDYEGEMAITQLKTICRHAEALQAKMTPDTNLPEWVQSKITLATDYMQTAHDYLMSELEEGYYGGKYRSAAWHADGGANDERHDLDTPLSKPVDQPHAVHINGKKWKTFGSQSHATNVARKIKGATVHKEEVELDEAKDSFGMPSHTRAHVLKKIKDGQWEAMRDVVPGKHVEVRDTTTNKTKTIHVKEEVELDEANFAGAMKSAIAAHERGDHKRAKYHLDNAKTARYAMKSTEITKHKDLLDKYSDLRKMHEDVELDEAKMDKDHPIVKEYDSLKKNHDIKSLRGLIKTQHKIIDTSEFKTKDHAISHYLRAKHGNKKVDQAFGFSEETKPIQPPSERSTAKHRILVTYSDPHHTAVSMRKEKQQKHIRVPATDKRGNTIYQGEAQELAKKYMKKQGYKVHDTAHAGLVTKTTEL